MSVRNVLTREEKERIYQRKLNGQTLAEIAKAIGCSLACARKWWRVGRDTGLQGLRAPRRGRGQTGTLSQFDPRIAAAAADLKQTHAGWGAKRVLVELRKKEEFADLHLPSASRLASYFKEVCPEQIRKPQEKLAPPAALPARAVHEIWQLDSQEKIELVNGEIVTICSVRDPVGAAMLMSRAFSVKTELRWRKLTWQEVRQVLRSAFSEWRTLPDALLTDNELGLAGAPTDPFPGMLTLWLVGLGIKHIFIRPGCPTDQPQIERQHRTLEAWALSGPALLDLEHVQQALDLERVTYNSLYPSQASNCSGRPPLVAHPELLTPRRYYQPEHELLLFDFQRVADYLATFRFPRKINQAAQISLSKQYYSLGKPLVRERGLERVHARLDPVTLEWVITPIPDDDMEGETELVRRPLKGLDVSMLTGLEPQPISLPQPIQLSLPFLVA